MGPAYEVLGVSANLELHQAAVAVSGIKLGLTQQFIPVPRIKGIPDAVPAKLNDVGHFCQSLLNARLILAKAG